MQIKDLKDLEKVIKLARKTGVQSIKVDNVELHLGPEPKAVKLTAKKPLVVESTDPLAYAKIPMMQDMPDLIDMPDELTDEQKLFWSADNQSA